MKKSIPIGCKWSTKELVEIAALNAFIRPSAIGSTMAAIDDGTETRTDLATKSTGKVKMIIKRKKR